jgi:hypothetical protein
MSAGGTDEAAHMVNNLGAGHGRLPDANQRVGMAKYMESLGSHAVGLRQYRLY